MAGLLDCPRWALPISIAWHFLVHLPSPDTGIRTGVLGGEKRVL